MSEKALEKLIALFSSIGRLSFTLGGACLVFYGLGWIIDLDPFGRQRLGVDDLHTWTGIAAVFFFAIFGADRLYAFGASRFNEWQSKQKAEKEHSHKVAVLHTLTPYERDLLRKYVDHQSTTFQLKTLDGAVHGLVKRGILYQAIEPERGDYHTVFNIEPWAYEYLLDHPELLEPKPKSEPRDQEQT
jgi:hypothetical protein